MHPYSSDMHGMFLQYCDLSLLYIFYKSIYSWTESEVLIQIYDIKKYKQSMRGMGIVYSGWTLTSRQSVYVYRIQDYNAGHTII